MEETKISKGLYVVTRIPLNKRGYHCEPIFKGTDLVGIGTFGLESNIWKFEEGKKVLIATRGNSVLDMFTHRNVIYDISRDYIHVTLLDPTGKKPIARNFLEITALCNHNGELYAIGGGIDVSRNGQVYPQWCGQIFKISGCPEEKEEILTKRTEENHSFSLCSHKGILYDASWNKIHNTLEDLTGEKPIAIRKHMINSLCSHDGILYDLTDNCVYRTLEDSEGQKPIMNINRSKKEIWARVLCSHNGVLYDGSDDGELFDTFENRLVYSFGEKIEVMISCP